MNLLFWKRTPAPDPLPEPMQVSETVTIQYFDGWKTPRLKIVTRQEYESLLRLAEVMRGDASLEFNQYLERNT